MPPPDPQIELPTARPAQAPPDKTRLSLTELTRAAGVSVRTVRYYIAEGLLPPPVGAGPRSAYTSAHLDRLRLINRLKATYLPLKEIRRRLAGLSDAEVAHLLATPESDQTAEPPADSAAAYLDRILASRPPATPPAPSPARPRAEIWGSLTPTQLPAPQADFEPGGISAMASAAPPASPPTDPTPPAPILGRAYPASMPSTIESEPDEPVPEADAWRRVPLGDDAELLIRESAYCRRRDRVEWLVAWARKVFG